MSEPFICTVREAAELLKTDEETIKRYVREGKLKSREVAGELRLEKEDVLKLRSTR